MICDSRWLLDRAGKRQISLQIQCVGREFSLAGKRIVVPLDAGVGFSAGWTWMVNHTCRSL